MTVLQTIAVAFSMFSALPMPQFEWNKRNMRYMLAAFPLIGLVIGLVMTVWQMLGGFLFLPIQLRGAGLCLIPVAITGGIHLDGYADTWDALSSHGTVEKKQEILKDPHIGAFAAIHLCAYFVISYGLWSAVPMIAPRLCFGMFTLSRALSGLAVATFPIAPHTGLAHSFADAADKTRVAWLLLMEVGAACALLCTGGLAGFFMTAAALLVFIYYRTRLQKQFGGLSGDLAGWFLQVAELAMLAAFVVAHYLGVFL